MAVYEDVCGRVGGGSTICLIMEGGLKEDAAEEPWRRVQRWEGSRLKSRWKSVEWCEVGSSDVIDNNVVIVDGFTIPYFTLTFALVALMEAF